MGLQSQPWLTAYMHCLVSYLSTADTMSGIWDTGNMLYMYLVFQMFYNMLFHLHICFWTVVLEKTLESPLDCKEIQPVHSEGDQPWDFFEGNNAEAETPVLWPPHAKSWLIGKDWCWEGLGAGGEGDDRGEIAGWHHLLDGCESEWTPGVGDGQGGLVCCDSWGAKSRTWLSDWTELNWTYINIYIYNTHLTQWLEHRRGLINIYWMVRPEASHFCGLINTFPGWIGCEHTTYPGGREALSSGLTMSVLSIILGSFHESN